MWESIIGFLSKPLTMWIDKSESRKYLREEGKLEITKAKVAFEVAKYQSQADRLLRNDAADSDYDMAAQREKRHTIADEVLLFCTIVLVACCFIWPAAMTAGWLAISTAPWWLEFIIVGIYISVFGLMRLFRAWTPFKKGD